MEPTLEDLLKTMDMVKDQVDSDILNGRPITTAGHRVPLETAIATLKGKIASLPNYNSSKIEALTQIAEAEKTLSKTPTSGGRRRSKTRRSKRHCRSKKRSKYTKRR